MSYSDSLISESESESEEESESDEDDGDEDEIAKGAVAGKDLSTVKEKDRKGKKTDAKTTAADDSDEVDEEYAEFLKFKAMMKAKNKS